MYPNFLLLMYFYIPKEYNQTFNPASLVDTRLHTITRHFRTSKVWTTASNGSGKQRNKLDLFPWSDLVSWYCSRQNSHKFWCLEDKIFITNCFWTSRFDFKSLLRLFHKGSAPHFAFAVSAMFLLNRAVTTRNVILWGLWRMKQDFTTEYPVSC